MANYELSTTILLTDPRSNEYPDSQDWIYLFILNNITEL